MFPFTNLACCVGCARNFQFPELLPSWSCWQPSESRWAAPARSELSCPTPECQIRLNVLPQIPKSSLSVCSPLTQGIFTLSALPPSHLKCDVTTSLQLLHFSHLQKPPIYMPQLFSVCTRNCLTFLPKNHLPKLSSSGDQRGEGAGRICCPPRQDAAPQLILQVAGAARPAGLRSSGSLWLLGIWITCSWLLQPYAEQLCWKICTWATWKCNSSKALGWPALPGWAAAAQHTQPSSRLRQDSAAAKASLSVLLVLLQWKTSHVHSGKHKHGQIVWFPAKPLLYFTELKMTESHLFTEKWGKGGERKQ